MAAPSLSASASSSLKFSALPRPRPPETTRARRDQLGARGLRELLPEELRLRRVGAGRDRLHGGGAGRRGLVEAGGAHRHHLDGVGRLHGRERVAGVDRAHEGVGRLDRDDLGDLRHVEECRHARHEVLADGGGARPPRASSPWRAASPARRGSRAARPRSAAASATRTLATPASLRGLARGGGASLPRDEHVHVAAHLRGGGDGVGGAGLQLRVVVLGNDEGGHLRSPSLRILSFATSSATSFTMTPPLRLGGSTTFRVFRRGATSTPRSAGLSVSSGFFFAFMMLGSVA